MAWRKSFSGRAPSLACGLAGLEALTGLLWLIFSPADPKSQVFLGFSAVRWGMIACFGAALVLAAGTGYFFFRKPEVLEGRWLKISAWPRWAPWTACLLLSFFWLFSLALILPASLLGLAGTYASRLKPLLLLGSLWTAQVLGLLALTPPPVEEHALPKTDLTQLVCGLLLAGLFFSSLLPASPTHALLVELRERYPLLPGGLWLGTTLLLFITLFGNILPTQTGPVLFGLGCLICTALNLGQLPNLAASSGYNLQNLPGEPAYALANTYHYSLSLNMLVEKEYSGCQLEAPRQAFSIWNMSRSKIQVWGGLTDIQDQAVYPLEISAEAAQNLRRFPAHTAQLSSLGQDVEYIFLLNDSPPCQLRLAQNGVQRFWVPRAIYQQVLESAGQP
jgi:hypothetical protein